MSDTFTGLTRAVLPGDILFQAGIHTPPLLVQSGQIMLEDADGIFVHLAHPGDVLGIECYGGFTSRFRAIAISSCIISSLPDDQRLAETGYLFEALMRQQQRTAETMRLRTGTATEWVKQLICQLGQRDDGVDLSQCQLPSLKTISHMIDVAPETVSRILSGLRRSAVLKGTARTGATFDPDHLSNYELPSEQIWKPGTRRLAKRASASPLCI
ncbi:hypothetical protein KSF73_00865 [Burkholderiaceae bacterium DAT-1]|nr:hypothetical protein [Burkholderiaceae bacterium DAT-1]